MNEFNKFLELTDKINQRIQMINRNLDTEMKAVENEIKKLEVK